MIQCPSCAGALRFDIKTQLMACDYCGNFYNPTDFDTARNAEEREMFETTVFTCPQCGGEIYSTGEQAAGFCTFCGTPTILESRLSSQKSPDFLIPFKITKEQCKQSYASMMRRAIYAPKELKDPAHVDEFRGIYMPYWTYYVTQQGPVHFNAKHVHRSGNYEITDHYALDANIDSYYKGISYDASSSFEDNISDQLAPYDVKGMKAFSPSYLSGFYADTADIDQNLYAEEAKVMAFEESMNQITHHPAFARYDVELNGLATPAQLNTRIEKSDHSLFPVWFLSYRNKDRVAYATVNGQTGKVVADIPIDPKKYVIGSLILAIPFFLLLSLLPIMTPVRAMLLVSIIEVIALFVYSRELKLIGEREDRSQDIGYLSKHDPEQLAETRRQRKTKMKIKQPKKVRNFSFVWIIVLVHFGLIFLPAIFEFIQIAASDLTSGSGTSIFVLGIWVALIILTIIQDVTIFKRFEKVPGKRGIVGIIASIVSITLAALLQLAQRWIVYDWIFYIATLIVIAAMYVTIIDILRFYNVLSTRRVPQFNYEGGDHRA